MVCDICFLVDRSHVVKLCLVDGDRIVLVGRDGVQYPPLHIKDKGGHLIAFLSCLETGLAPSGRLDPPLWFEKEQGSLIELFESFIIDNEGQQFESNRKNFER